MPGAVASPKAAPSNLLDSPGGDPLARLSSSTSTPTAGSSSAPTHRAPPALVLAVASALELCVGTFGAVFLFQDYPGLMLGARRGSPLILRRHRSYIKGVLLPRRRTLCIHKPVLEEGGLM